MHNFILELSNLRSGVDFYLLPAKRSTNGKKINFYDWDGWEPILPVQIR